ncbi:MAG: sporulation protein YunB [Clostridia bacterium]|nr:sporulation protein YunB [Clostridia bacterium]
MKRRHPGKYMFFIVVIFLFATLCIFTFAELRIRPLVRDAAKSRARTYASEIINLCVTETLSKSSQLVRVTSGADGVASVETNIASLSSLRASAIKELTKTLSDSQIMSFTVPLGNLSGSTLIAGRGIPIEIKLVPIGDVTADVRTEFIESGINQTLHKITLRVRVTLNVLTSGSAVKLEVASDVTLAETVIVGKVPDAYTAINRYEIDEDEENDLNDYAATLP